MAISGKKYVNIVSQMADSGISVHSGAVPVIPTGGSKYGIDINALIGDVDSDGVLQPPVYNGDIIMSGVKSIPSDMFYYKFYACGGNYTFSAPDLETLGGYALRYAFMQSGGLKKVSLPVLETVGASAFAYAFQYCTGLTEVEFGFVELKSSMSWLGTFTGCTGLQTVSLPRLGLIASIAFQNCFNVSGCAPRQILVPRLGAVTSTNGLAYLFAGYSATSPGQLERVDFPSLYSIQENAFGSSAPYYAFRNQPNLTEIHFRADARAAVEATNGYADKWGAENATIYFDL